MGDVVAMVPERVEGEAKSLAARAACFEVTDAGTYAAGAELRKACKAALAEIADVFRPMAKAADEAHKRVLVQERRFKAPVEEADRQLAARMVTWQTAEERRVREERARLEEAARREEEERLVAVAVDLEAEGSPEEAAAVMEEASSMPAPIVQVASAVPKVAGLSSREAWKAEVVDINALIEAAATRPELRALLMPNTVAIGQMARALKSAARIPGVRVYAERTHTVRA